MSGMKRPSLDDASTSGPPEKRREGEEPGTAVETVIKLGGVSNTEEQDIRALVAKNRKLAEALDQRQGIEDELRDTIEKLERRQATDDASLLIINRYWSQFDENIRLIMKRYDLETQLSDLVTDRRTLEPTEIEHDSDSNQERSSVREKEREERDSKREDRGQSEAPLSFLANLASSSSEEMESQLQERLEFSQRAVERTVEIYDSLQETIERLEGAITDPERFQELVTELNGLLSRENQRLQELADLLQEKHRRTSKEFSVLGKKVEKADSRVSELQSKTEDLQWDIDKIRKREQRLNRHLAEVLERVNSKGYKVYGGASSLYGGTITINERKFEEMNSELEENKELAANRLAELQKLKQDLQQVNSENERMMVEVRNLAEVAVRDSSEYRCLQSQFSVLYNESLQLKSHLDEARSRLHGTRGARLRQLDHMEHDEIALQKKLRTEVIQLEDTLAQVRKEYEMLRIEFEQTLAANEQAGPINREMRHLISSLQNHNHQMKGEVQKCKRRLREAQAELAKARLQRGSMLLQPQSSTELEPKEDCVTSPVTPTSSLPTDNAVKTEPEAGSTPVSQTAPAGVISSTAAVKIENLAAAEEEEETLQPLVKEEEKEKEREKERERISVSNRSVKEEREREKSASIQSEDSERPGGVTKRKEMEQLKLLRAELKKAQESQKEMKLLLDMYRSAPKEQRDKVQLMAAERKSKAEVEELRQRLRELEEREKKEGKKMADEEALRKMRSVEEQMENLHKKLSIAKQEEEALLSEMDVTGQAFEDMQEQNIRLMQQLREKDDANFKLMSERIKANQIHKLLKEEKEELADQVLTLKTQVDAQLQVVRKLEEKEHLLQNTITTAEKDLSLRSQALEMNKRKATDATQLADEVKSQLESIQSKLRSMQEEIIENSVSREKEAFNSRRAQEDIFKLRRKLEKTKKPDTVPNSDDILNEEIKEFKTRLTCPCCNSRVKDAVLTKCFHVFCFECVKTRYDTRQRKCPKCNAAFGANDFHRIYIG
ncbi:E3 ubiquitin-protein ligase BRE1A [Polypterus senegalus]|uniref:E3 ubiquitin-protein ligase BRE1A n=1 Tax=Polypterus senegalus TaxID=55291 RepID=UPI001966BADE|nr:E3 ubiquitin-protein ligase BRE1A [Polypterus senegalus]